VGSSTSRLSGGQLYAHKSCAVAHTVKLMAEAPAAQAAAAAAVAVVDDGPLLPLSVVAAEATAEAAP